jgi:hypothetical protein
MSQRLKAGFNWPEFTVSAWQPFDVIPETTCSFNGRLFLSIVSWLAFPSLQSLAAGVAQVAVRVKL